MILRALETLVREIRQWSVLIITLLVLGLLGYFSKYWAYHKIQDCLKTKVEGTFEPHPFLFQFQIHGAKFRIVDKIRVEDGDILVRYQILGVFPSPKFRVQVASENAVIFLEGKWFKNYPFEQTKVEKFYTDMSINQDGIKGIHSVIVKTKDFSFQLAPPSASPK